MKVLQLLTDESRWTKGALARDANGLRVYEHPSIPNESACAWCLVGAIERCYSTESTDVLRRVYCAINGVEATPLTTGIANISSWNDRPSRTFDEVLDVVKSLNI